MEKERSQHLFQDADNFFVLKKFEPCASELLSLGSDIQQIFSCFGQRSFHIGNMFPRS